MSQGETDNDFSSQPDDDEVAINLNFSAVELNLLHDLGFNDDF